MAATRSMVTLHNHKNTKTKGHIASTLQVHTAHAHLNMVHSVVNESCWPLSRVMVQCSVLYLAMYAHSEIERTLNHHHQPHYRHTTQHKPQSTGHKWLQHCSLPMASTYGSDKQRAWPGLRAHIAKALQ